MSETVTGPNVDTTPEDGEVVVVIGAKGGCGASTVVASLGALSAADRRTCVLDLDVGKGDLATYLGLDPGRTLRLVLDQLDQLDAELFEGALVAHTSGLRALLQPDALADLHRLYPEDVERLLDVVRATHRATFVDVGSRIDVPAIAAARMADAVLVVTTPTVPALRDARRVLTLLGDLEVRSERVHVVLARTARGWPGPGEVEQLLDVPVFAAVARDERACRKADEDGVPVALHVPGAAVARDLVDLLARLRGEAPVPRTMGWRAASWLPFPLGGP